MRPYIQRETIEKARQQACKANEPHAVVVWEDRRQAVVPFDKAVLRGDDLYAIAYPDRGVKWLKWPRSEDEGAFTSMAMDNPGVAGSVGDEWAVATL